MLLHELQNSDSELSKDQLAILADTRERIDSGPGAFTVTTNALFQADGVEVYGFQIMTYLMQQPVSYNGQYLQV
ncbi:hypothetical protein Tco_1348989 [Tanacetum coccineum]